MRDRLLAFSFIISLVVNFLWIVIVGNSDIFQTQVTRNELRVEHLHLVRPPLKKPIPPKKKLPPPPPPPSPVKLPPPPKTPPPMVRPTVQHQTPPPPQQVLSTPPPAAIPNGNEIVQQPTQPTQPEQPPTPQPPTPQPPTPQPPTPTPEPPPPVIVKPPPPAIPDRYSAVPSGGFHDIDFSDIDMSQVTNTNVTVECYVDKNGHAFNIRIKKSSGNSDLDDRIKQAVSETKFIPRIIDGDPQVSQISHDFSIGT